MTAPRFGTALITGGSTGIGAAIARELVAQGTHVAIVARNKDALDALARELGGDTIALVEDIADAARAKQIVDEAHARLGSLDLVIANAGIGGNRHAERLEPMHFVKMLETNVIGACATIAAAIPHVLGAGRGHLVGISSLAGTRGLPGSAAYSASKAALSTFLESIRVDLARTSIRVTDIRPGFVDTPLTQKNRYFMPFLVPADVAGKKIVDAIMRERRVFAFPWPMALGARLLAWTPNAIYDFLANRVKVEKVE